MHFINLASQLLKVLLITLLLLMAGSNEVNVLHIAAKSHAASNELINRYGGLLAPITGPQHVKKVLEVPGLEVKLLEFIQDSRAVQVLLQVWPADGTCAFQINMMQESLEL